MRLGVTVEATQGCGAARVLLFALAELGIEHRLVARSDGYFLERHGRPGPVLRDEANTFVGLAACLDHLASPSERAAIEAFTRRFHPALRAVLAKRDDEATRAELERALRDLSEALGDRKYLLDAPSLADTNALSLRVAAFLGFDLVRWPSLVAYRARVESRPAWELASTEMDEMHPETLLRFWFGDAPADSEGALIAKVRRWFQGGPDFDRAIEARFSRLVRKALAGDLDAWTATPRGRLALVIALDQLPRNLHREEPRAYAGDARAQEIALEAMDAGAQRALSAEERIFLNMPLVHAEDPVLQERAVAEARALAADAEPSVRDALSMAVEQAAKYRDVIARFGRFPHRNVILGRESSPEEEAFLIGWRERVPPARLRAGAQSRVA